MRNEIEESVIVGTGLQVSVVSVEDTHRLVPGVQHMEGGRMKPTGICRDLVGTGSNTMQTDGFLLLSTCARGFLQRRIFVLLFSCLKQYADSHVICKT